MLSYALGMLSSWFWSHRIAAASGSLGTAATLPLHTQLSPSINQLRHYLGGLAPFKRVLGLLGGAAAGAASAIEEDSSAAGTGLCDQPAHANNSQQPTECHAAGCPAHRDDLVEGNAWYVLPASNA